MPGCKHGRHTPLPVHACTKPLPALLLHPLPTCSASASGPPSPSSPSWPPAAAAAATRSRPRSTTTSRAAMLDTSSAICVQEVDMPKPSSGAEVWKCVGCFFVVGGGGGGRVAVCEQDRGHVMAAQQNTARQCCGQDSSGQHCPSNSVATPSICLLRQGYDTHHPLPHAAC